MATAARRFVNTNMGRAWNGVAAGNLQSGYGRRRNHPSWSVIARAQRHLWRGRIPTVAEAEKRCWACLLGADRRGGFEKAHIQPVRFGGSDEPWNILILCWECHDEQDDEASRKDQLAWLRMRQREWAPLLRHCSEVFAFRKAAV